MTQPQSEDHLEVEWQFQAVDVRPVARWLETAALGGFRATPAGERQLDDRYLDTPGWRVHAAGYTCRIRARGESAELTLKAMAGATDGLRMRRELTEQLSAATLEAAAAAPGPAGAALRFVTGQEPLRELFRLRTTRHTYALADLEGAIGEVALDETAIPIDGDDAPVRFTRVEIEVPADALERARPFVRQFVAGCALAPAITSKFEAALLAAGLNVPAPPDLGPTAVSREMTTADVAFAALRKQFGVFLANEPGTRLGEDIEALHDMRVAARRLRAAMQTFRPFLSPRTEAFRVALAWVARSLGEVRDLDVQLERMAEWREGLPPAQSHALDAIEELLWAHRTAARRRMLAVLDSRRYESFVDRFTSTLRRGPARSFAPGRQRILATAPALLEKRYRGLRKHGDAIKPASPPEAYHALRIDGKRLRYALEFVGPVYGRPAIAFARRVTALQDLLGQHQDAEVARAMLANMAATNRRLSPETLMAMGMVAERYRVHAEALRRDFPKVYAPLRGADWKPLQKALERNRPQPRPAPTTGRIAPASTSL